MQNNLIINNITVNSWQDVEVLQITDDLLFYKYNEADVLQIPKITELRDILEVELEEILKAELLAENVHLNDIQNVKSAMTPGVLNSICKKRAKNIENIITKYTGDNKHALMGQFSVSLLSGQFRDGKDDQKKHIAILLKQIEYLIEIILKTEIDHTKIEKNKEKKAKEEKIIIDDIIAQIYIHTGFKCIEGSIERLESIVQSIQKRKISEVEANLHEIIKAWLLRYCAMLVDPKLQAQLNPKQKELLHTLNFPQIEYGNHIHNVHSLWNCWAKAFGLSMITQTVYMKTFSRDVQKKFVSHMKEELNNEFISILADHIEGVIKTLPGILRASGDFKDNAEHTAEQLIKFAVCEKFPDILSQYGINYSKNDIEQAKINDIKKAAMNIVQVVGKNQEPTEEAKLKAANSINNNLIIQSSFSEDYTLLLNKLSSTLRAAIALSPKMKRYIIGTKTEISPVQNQNNSYVGYDVLNTGKEIVIHVDGAIYYIFNAKIPNSEKKSILERKIAPWKKTYIGEDFANILEYRGVDAQIIKYRDDNYFNFDYEEDWVFDLQIRSDDTEKQIIEYISYISGQQREQYKKQLASYFQTSSQFIIYSLNEIQIEQLLNFFDIKQDQKKMEILFSSNAFNTYRAGIEPNTLSKIADISILKALVDCYTDIKDKAKIEKIHALTSPDAQICYAEKYLNVDDLKNLWSLNLAEIEALISKDARRSYAAECCTVFQLKNLKAEQIRIITSFKILPNIKDLDKNTIEALTSYNAQRCYKNKYCDVDTMYRLYNLYMMNRLYYEKVVNRKETTFANLQRYLVYCCDEGHAGKIDMTNPSIIFQLSEDIINNDAQILKENIEEISKDIIEKLSKDDMKNLFIKPSNQDSLDILRKIENSKILGFIVKYKGAESSNSDIDRIEKIIQDASNRISKMVFSPEDRKTSLYHETKKKTQLDIQKEIYSLIHNTSQVAGFAKFGAISEKFVLQQDICRKLVKYAMLKMEEKKVHTECEMNIKTIEALTSEDALICYREKYFTIDDLQILMNLNLTKIEILTSIDAQRCYAAKYLTVADLINLDPRTIKTLTSLDARMCYAEKYLRFADLISLDKAKIKALTSEDAQRCYAAKCCTVSDLKNLKTHQISIITSFKILPNIKNFDAKTIAALTSRIAQRCYENKYCDVDTMYALYIRHMMDQLYNKEFFNNFKKNYSTFQMLQRYLIYYCEEGHADKIDWTNPSAIIRLTLGVIHNNIRTFKENVKEISKDIIEKLSVDDMKTLFIKQNNDVTQHICYKIKNDKILNFILEYKGKESSNVDIEKIREIIQESSDKMSQMVFEPEDRKTCIYRCLKEAIQLDIQKEIYNLVKNIANIARYAKDGALSRKFISQYDVCYMFVEDAMKEMKEQQVITK